MANSAEIIYELKEKCEYYKKQNEKLRELYINDANMKLDAIVEHSKLTMLLNEIKAEYPETIDLINQRLGEMKND